MNWGIFFLGILSGIIIKIIGEILNPTVAELGAKLHSRIWRKPYISGNLAADLSRLDSLQKPLININAIPRYPDSYKNIKQWLLEIDDTARKLQTKKTQKIKERLLNFASPINGISINTSLDEVMRLFTKKNKAYNLLEDIRTFIAEEKKR